MRKAEGNPLPIVVLLFWITTVSADQVTENFPQEFDFRYTSYEELIENVVLFEHPDIVGYVQLTIDKDNDQLLLGARDSLFRLSLDNLNALEVLDASADNNTVETCLLKGQQKEHCHNFIRVLLLHNDTNIEHETGKAVFVCGTNAFEPQCSWRQATNLSNILEDGIKGAGKAPNSPIHNSTAIMTANGDFYGATVVDIRGRDPAIYRSMGVSARLRTVQYDSKWLNEPNFVSAYDFGQFVYFFFREVAVEFINCGKRIYSRVARLCKTDRGGSFFLDTTWTSYFKARLNCSIPGEYPFYFDELQSTFNLTVGNQEYVYAVFTTPVNSIAGSAICVYNMTAFNTSFEGPFKYQEGPRSAWERHDNSNPLVKCPDEKKDASKRSNEEDDEEKKQSMITQKYQMMDLAVQPNTSLPLMHQMNERWTHVVVDSVTGKKGVYNVVFIATDDGRIRKMLKLPTTDETCLIEEIKIVPNGEPKPVKAMKIYPKENAIFISTNNSVIKIPLERCSRFKNRDMCLNSNDPYCGWNDYSEGCTPAPLGQAEVYYWSQSMNSCPFVPHPVDGEWSDWSEWTKCSQVGDDPSVGDCLCRSRSCDNPKPYYGGQPCFGSSVEVANCTAHGQWTEWAEWSSCSQSCGSTAVRSRRRYCGNPPPRFGGRECVGTDSEEEYCRGHPPCPLPPVQGNWTEWSEWSDCSAKCNGGIQTRRRSCKEPPAVKVIPCAGSTQEWRMCNTHICEELDKMTPWTPWVSLNHSKGGYFQERFRFHCKANVSSQSMMGVKTAKPQVRFCFDGGSCHDSGELRNEIDTFSPIDRVLRRYCKHRRKLFKKYCRCKTLGIFLVCQKCNRGYG